MTGRSRARRRDDASHASPGLRRVAAAGRAGRDAGPRDATRLRAIGAPAGANTASTPCASIACATSRPPGRLHGHELTTLHSRRGSRPRLPRHRRLGADRRRVRRRRSLLRRGGDRLLVDCAEGTQRQLLRSNIGLVELREVFLTHYHADHYLGLPGMLKTFALRGRELPITIYGPRGLDDLFAALRRIFGKLTYPYELVELQAGDVARPRRRTASSRSRCTHGVAGARLRARRGDRARAASTSPTADALGVPAGPERGRAAAGEAMALADGARRHARSRCSAAARRAQGRHHRRHRAVARRCSSSRRAPSARPRGDVLRGGARARARRRSHSTAREAARGGARPPGCSCSR